MSTEGIPGSRPSLPHETSAHQLNVPASRSLPQATRLPGVHASPSSCPKRGRGMRRALIHLSRGCLVRIPASFLGEVSMANPRITRNRIGFEADDLQRQLDEVRAQLRSLRMR